MRDRLHTAQADVESVRAQLILSFAVFVSFLSLFFHSHHQGHSDLQRRGEQHALGRQELAWCETACVRGSWHSQRFALRFFSSSFFRVVQKGGFEPGEVPDIRPFSGVAVQGLMTMAAQHDDPELCRPAFAQLRQLKEQLGAELPHLSMGMSNDFEVAIEEGATLIRVGSTLFGGLEGE